MSSSQSQHTCASTCSCYARASCSTYIPLNVLPTRLSSTWMSPPTIATPNTAGGMFYVAASTTSSVLFSTWMQGGDSMGVMSATLSHTKSTTQAMLNVFYIFVCSCSVGNSDWGYHPCMVPTAIIPPNSATLSRILI